MLPGCQVQSLHCGVLEGEGVNCKISETTEGSVDDIVIGVAKLIDKSPVVFVEQYKPPFDISDSGRGGGWENSKY